ncbi:sulfotransferase domain-containing protein [Aquisalimonas asiatica]|uniref:sulfotransferase domain-containing protein n=1 Tax=Aquisalimonas asiatica TaxID=406100 RepID=UPI001495F47E|nr:sulfotransferase domain-containing protein [Aquisalimonas asiatica]
MLRLSRFFRGGRGNHSLPSSSGLPPRVLLAAQPKSGTYLYAEILKEIGFDFTYIHLAPEKIQAYDKNMPRMTAENPRLFDCRIPLVESRRLIRTGQVGASHLTPEEVGDYFEDFKVVAVNRELRSSFVSFVNFFMATGRGSKKVRARVISEGICGFMRERGARYIDHALGIRSWSGYQNALVVRYEDLHCDPESQVSDISGFLGGASVQGSMVYEKALAAQTMTKSKGKSSVAWGEEEENIFVGLGGVEANKKMGYSG